MKRERRLIYLKLVNLPTVNISGLCNLCKYAKWSSNCSDIDLRCEHPIDKIAENAYEAWAGSDCWAFRPNMAFDDIVDMIGFGLQGLQVDWNSVSLLTDRKARTNG